MAIAIFLGKTKVFLADPIQTFPRSRGSNSSSKNFVCLEAKMWIIRCVHIRVLVTRDPPTYTLGIFWDCFWGKGIVPEENFALFFTLFVRIAFTFSTKQQLDGSDMRIV